MVRIKNIAYGIGVAMGVALAGKGCLEMSRFSNTQELIEDYKATSTYIELKALADLDESGKLSEIERKLMFARLDDCRFGLGGHWRWEDIVKKMEERMEDGGRTYWTPEDRSRVSHALALYRQEKIPKQ